MATAPVKQLHNFPLSLKWGTQTQPCRLVSDSDAESHPSSLRSSLPPPLPLPRVGSRSARHHRFSFSPCSTSLTTSQRPEKRQRSPKQSPSITPPEDHQKPELETEEDDESALRPWKLRPRKQNNASAVPLTAPTTIKEPPPILPATEPKSTRLRGIAESSTGEGTGLSFDGRKVKRKIWITLSRDEIEEDVFILTGSRPARRPKKRPKNVQKVLDSVFPGLWLVGSAADSYRISETPLRGR